MKLMLKKSTLIAIVKFLKWSKVTAQFVAIGTTISGAVAALCGSSSAGIALTAGGATAYAATKGVPQTRYEKTKHIPPGRVDRQANLLRKREMESVAKEQGRRNAVPGMGPRKSGMCGASPMMMRKK